MALVAVLLAAACATDPAGDEGVTGGGGKADGAGTPDAQCSTQYIEWVLGTMNPALNAQPIDAARATELETLAQQAPCRGQLLSSAAFTSWMDVTASASVLKYVKQHADARVAFLMNGSAVKGDIDAFHASSEMTESQKLAVRVMQKARGSFVIDRLAESDWLNLYHSLAEEALQQLTDPALLSIVEDSWTLNAGEAEALDLAATTRPTGTSDGGFAAWVEEYGAILRDGINIDDTDDYVAAVPSPAGRTAFLDRFVALRPAAHGDDDSRQWMFELALWAPIAASSTQPFAPNDAAQLARIDAVRPTSLTGNEAYRKWLDAVADTATIGGGTVYARSVVPAKPCTADGDALYAQFIADNAALPQTVKDAARPAACR